MDDDQQFCLRWNNHQSTLISVFDTLLENGTLVDCTLAAEGKFLKAHKVVLSACSPYFAALLSQQYDKHPIFILKDVKFQELRAMMDYMYRGEVNISQDQLAALLKAAESLQIKGLSDSRGNSTQNKDTAKPPPASAKASELKIENKRPMRSLGPELDTDIGSREGSTSPTSRKRKKIRRRSIDTNNVDNHDQLSNSSSHSMPHNVNTSLANQTQPHTNQISTTSSSATTNLQTPVTKKTEQQQKPESHNQHNKAESNNDETNDNDDDSENDNDVPPQPQKRVKESSGKEASNNADLLLEPKNEYDDDDGQPVEDLTLDDEELLEEDMDEAGPSHGGGEGSSQGGYAQWQMERSQDEAFMAAQEAGGQHRDAQGKGRKKKGAVTIKPSDTPRRNEAEILNDCLLENKNIVFAKKDNSFILFTKMMPQTSTVGGATMTTATTALPVMKSVMSTPTPITVGQGQGDGTSFVFEECEIVPAAAKKPMEKLANVSIQKLSTIYAPPLIKTTPVLPAPPLILAQPPPIITAAPVLKKPKASHPRIKYSKHINPATMTTVLQQQQQVQQLQQQHNLQQHVQQMATVQQLQHQQAIIATLQSQFSHPVVSQPLHIQTIKAPNSNDTISFTIGGSGLITATTNAATNSRKVFTTTASTPHQHVDYDASASNTSQSNDFPVGIIDDLDISGIDDIELPDDVQMNFGDSFKGGNDSGETTTIIHTGDDKYTVVLNPKASRQSGKSITSTSSNKDDGNLSGNENVGDDGDGDSDDGSRQHACQHCGKRYRWKSTLRRHESVECGGKEASHQCPYCTYKAKQRGNLGVHVRKHHPEMPQLLTRRSKKSMEAFEQSMNQSQ